MNLLFLKSETSCLRENEKQKECFEAYYTTSTISRRHPKGIIFFLPHIMPIIIFYILYSWLPLIMLKLLLDILDLNFVYIQTY